VIVFLFKSSVLHIKFRDSNILKGIAMMSRERTGFSRIVIFGLCETKAKKGEPKVCARPRRFMPDHLTDHLVDVIKKNYRIWQVGS
jgi:hypothetical protein